MNQERRHPRAASRQRCWCEGDDITIYAQVGNISEGGLFLRTSAPLPPGARVRLRLSLGPGEVEVPARVAWRRDPRLQAAEEDPGMGLRFEPTAAAELEVLRSHVERLLRAGA